MKVLCVFGTRPEAIKMAPVVHELRRRPEQFAVSVAVTAQHRGMLDEVLSLFGIAPEYDLDIMQARQDLYQVTARALLGLRDVLDAATPDVVLVHGDTTTTLAAALAAFYKKIPVGHVEAGLRTRDLYSPWPEEANRQLTGRLARHHFAPTARNRQHLLDEGVSEAAIAVTGNTVIDALLWVNERLNTDRALRADVETRLLQAGYVPGERPYVLVTAHRRESFGEPLENIVAALKSLAASDPGLDIVYPVHPNPNVAGPVRAGLGGYANVKLLDPVRYDEMVRLMAGARLLLTDSGGLQEEGPSLGKPVLVLREKTERPEAVEAGTVRLVGTDTARIVALTRALLDEPAEYARMARAHNPYGDGHASRRIADFLLERATPSP